MKKIIKQKPQPKSQTEEILGILKILVSRMEDATIDIHSMKSDLAFINSKLGIVEHNIKLMKVDIEDMKLVLHPIDLTT